ncbi:MAG: M48 family metallopeptidase [Rhodospirillales bacterium]|jgi:predicted metal-dependent hydrolase|nr:M48 family metallopeptidase [Rhodospirillales bacterium]
MALGSGRTRERLTSLTVAGREMPLVIRRHPRARRLTLRLRVDSDGVVVTIPERAAFADGVALARTNSGWIAERLESRPERVGFCDGAILPLRGIDHEIRHAPAGPHWVRVENNRILISGPEAELAARLAAWLRRQARGDLERQIGRLAPKIGRPLGRVGVRDTRSRWGSCSAAGALSFSWRLILAPSAVLDYVVAHELAHLAERNHGPRFWALVATLHGEGVADARAWLRQHGPGLHRYG